MDQLTPSFLSAPYSRSSSLQPPGGQKAKTQEEDTETSNSELEDEGQQASFEVIESIQLKTWFKKKLNIKSYFGSGSQHDLPKVTKTSSGKEDSTKTEGKSRKWNFANSKQTGIKPQFTQSKELDVKELPKASALKARPKISLGQARSMEGKEEANLVSLCLEGKPSGALGVVNHRAFPCLQTQAFHKLKLEQLVSAYKLEDIVLSLSNPASLVLEAKTLRDSITQKTPSSRDKSQSDVILPLLSVQVEREQGQLLGGAFVNNYPTSTVGAQINCDFFHGELHPDYMFSLIADGCNWGTAVRLAAQRAVVAATQFINQMLTHSSQPVKTAENLAWVLVQAMAMAHEAIVSGYRDAYGVGTTTLNICFVFMTPEGKKYLMVAGVGDCKVLLATQTVNDQYTVSQVECSKRLNFKATDPGGRLGPYVGTDYIDPDLRNLSITFIPLPEEKSIIFNMTDGVHDNLQPEMLGKEPSDLDTALPSSTKWSDLIPEKRQEMAIRYQNALLERIINDAVTKKPDASLDNICESITDYCHQVTAYGRNFMETNPHKNEPSDKKLNPGKMDHCSIVALQV
jgi:serine/threonine protein phosphatase PrpC